MALSHLFCFLRKIGRIKFDKYYFICTIYLTLSFILSKTMKTKTKLPTSVQLLKHAEHPILRTLGEALLCCVAFFVGIGIYSLSNSFAEQSLLTHNSAEAPTADEQIVASCPVTFETQTTKIYSSPSDKLFFNNITKWPTGKFHTQASPTCDVLKSRCGAFGFEDNDCDSYCGR